MKEYKESPLLDNFETIVQTVADANYDGDTLRAALLLVYDVCIRKELAHLEDNTNVSQALSNCSTFRSGQEVMNFLFDVINHISGYTGKYYDETKELMSHDDLVRKYRAERDKYEGKDINQSNLLGDKYPHSLLVIEGVHELLQMPGSDIKVGGFTEDRNLQFALPVHQTRSLASEYLDALLLRVQSANDDWYRNHFPVLFETNKSHYFGEKIYNQANLDEFSFPTVEYGVAISGGGIGPQPFETNDKVQQLKHIFNKDQIEAMERKLGRSIYLTHVFTELAKARKAEENFDSILQLTDPAFKRIKLEYEHRLNKLYTHPLLGDLLDSGEIDFALLSLLSELARVFTKNP